MVKNKLYYFLTIALVVSIGVVLFLCGSKRVFDWQKLKPDFTVVFASASISEGEPCSLEGEWKVVCLGKRDTCPEDAGVGEVYRCENGKWKFKYPECNPLCVVTPCQEGAWKVECLGRRGPCPEDTGEAEAYRCEGGVWQFKYPECNPKCAVDSLPTPTPSPSPPSSPPKACCPLQGWDPESLYAYIEKKGWSDYLKCKFPVVMQQESRGRWNELGSAWERGVLQFKVPTWREAIKYMGWDYEKKDICPGPVYTTPKNIEADLNPDQYIWDPYSQINAFVEWGVKGKHWLRWTSWKKGAAVGVCTDLCTDEEKAIGNDFCY